MEKTNIQYKNNLRGKTEGTKPVKGNKALKPKKRLEGGKTGKGRRKKWPGAGRESPPLATPVGEMERVSDN